MASRILIVEDEVILAKDLARNLKHIGYEVIGRVSSSEEAIRVAGESKPDLILMDIDLDGDIDGIAAAEIIRRRVDIPVVYLTGFAEKDVVERAKKTEPYGYLSKPVGLLELRSTVETALYKHEAYMRVRESESKYRTLFETMVQGVVYQDSHGSIISANPAAERILGMTVDEMQGRTSVDPQWQAIHPDGSPFPGETHPGMKALRTGEPVRGSLMGVYNPKDKDYRWISIDAVPLFREGEQKPYQVYTTFEDITDRKKAEEALIKSERRFHSIFANAAVGIDFLDGNGRFVEVNSTLAEMLGYSRQELLNLTPLDVTHQDDVKKSRDNLNALMRREIDSYRLEKRFIRKDGSILFADVMVSAIVDANGSHEATIGVIADITDRKRLEWELQESESFLIATGQMAKVGGWELEVETKEVRWTEQTYHIHEVPLDQKPSMKEALSFFHPEDRPRLEAAIQRAIHNGEPYDMEMRFRSALGNDLWSRTICKPIVQNGKTVKLVGTFQDITDSEKMEIALRDSENRFRALSENTFEAIFLSEKGVCTAQNLTAEKMFGYTADEAVGMKGTDWIAPEYRKLVKQNMLLDHAAPYKAMAMRKDGTTFPCEIQGRTVDYQGGPIRVTALRDITDRKKAEDLLKNQVFFLSSLLEAIPAPVFFKNTDHIYTGCNEAFARFIGRDKEEIIGKTVFDIAPEELAEVYRARDQQLLENPGTQIYESSTRGDDGLMHDVIFHKATFRNSSGELAGLIGVILDITDRKKAEQAMSRNRDMLARTEAVANMGSWEWDIATDTVTWSGELFRIFQRTPTDRAPSFAEHPELYHPEDMESLRHAVEEAITQGTPYELELRAIRNDGETRYCIARGNAILDKGGRVSHLYGSLQDITERKKAEDKIKASLAEKEVLLREIHHRVKNNLALINSLLGLRAEYPTEKPTKEQFDDVKTRIRSMAVAHEILYQSDNLSHLSAPDYIGNLLNHLLYSQASVGLSYVTVEKEIEEVSFGLSTAIPLGFLLTELVSNCFKHAFPGGRPGKVRVCVRAVDEKEFELAVADDGVGIPEGVDLENPPSMGMELISTFVEQLHGRIEINRNNGTEVLIRFKEIGHKATR